MIDHRSISSEAAPRLTSHLRALALIAPLQRAEDNKGMLHVAAKAAERVDMRYLALAAIEFLIDRMGAGGTASRAELIDYLADLGRLQSRSLSSTDDSVSSGLHSHGKWYSIDDCLTYPVRGQRSDDRFVVTWYGELLMTVEPRVLLRGEGSAQWLPTSARQLRSFRSAKPQDAGETDKQHLDAVSASPLARSCNLTVAERDFAVGRLVRS
jgi:hypothetical protein